MEKNMGSRTARVRGRIGSTEFGTDEGFRGELLFFSSTPSGREGARDGIAQKLVATHKLRTDNQRTSCESGAPPAKTNGRDYIGIGTETQPVVDDDEREQ